MQILTYKVKGTPREDTMERRNTSKTVNPLKAKPMDMPTPKEANSRGRMATYAQSGLSFLNLKALRLP